MARLPSPATFVGAAFAALILASCLVGLVTGRRDATQGGEAVAQAVGQALARGRDLDPRSAASYETSPGQSAYRATVSSQSVPPPQGTLRLKSEPTTTPAKTSEHVQAAQRPAPSLIWSLHAYRAAVAASTPSLPRLRTVLRASRAPAMVLAHAQGPLPVASACPVLFASLAHDEAAASGELPGPLAAAAALLGTPYRAGSDSPEVGFDCSGMTSFAFRAAGVELPRSSRDQFAIGKPVSRNALVPGDLVFFRIGPGISHVGIYQGEGKFIHSRRAGDVVGLDSLADPYWDRYYAGARRVAAGPVAAEDLDRMSAQSLTLLSQRSLAQTATRSLAQPMPRTLAQNTTKAKPKPGEVIKGVARQF